MGLVWVVLGSYHQHEHTTQDNFATTTKLSAEVVHVLWQCLQLRLVLCRIEWGPGFACLGRDMTSVRDRACTRRLTTCLPGQADGMLHTSFLIRPCSYDRSLTSFLIRYFSCAKNVLCRSYGIVHTSWSTSFSISIGHLAVSMGHRPYGIVHAALLTKLFTYNLADTMRLTCFADTAFLIRYAIRVSDMVFAMLAHRHGSRDA